MSLPLCLKPCTRHALAVGLGLLLTCGVHAQKTQLAQTATPGASADSTASLAARASSTASNGAPGVQVPPSRVPALQQRDTSSAIRTFGSQLFGGHFAGQSFAGFNPDYQLSAGDRVVLRLWGAFSLDTTQVVDAQGNIFLPNIGPIRVQGIRNAELNDVVQQQVKRVFRANVQSYANLDAAQPVKIYVTGFVRQPGLYNGLSSDSVLHYLDAAGGIDPDRGSYLDVQVLRGQQIRARIDLYRFLLEGRIETMQLHDGDTILVTPRRFAVQVGGDVVNEAQFELRAPEITADQILALAQPKASATHLSVVRWKGAQRNGEYHPIADAPKIRIGHGDEVTVTSDKVPGTLLIRIDGAHRGQRTAVLPYGSRLKDALALVQPAPQAKLQDVQLYRRSIANRQKEMLAVALDKLETQALTARSATNEEATLRTREAELVLQFTQRARSVEPKGRLVLPQLEQAGNTLLEDGDVLVLPEQSSQVAVFGEVMFPMAIQYDEGRVARDYVALAGGFTQNADTSRVLLLRKSGAVQETSRHTRPEAGEELIVLPKADTKNIEVTRGITQIIYQVAIAAKVALGL